MPEVRGVLGLTLSMFLNILWFFILARILMSWFRPMGGYYRRGGGDFMDQAQDFLFRVTEPILDPIRRILPTSGMGLDFAPLVALLLIRVLLGAVRYL